ncbi:AAA-12 domain-containing protein [Mycena indigotica]|uniref:AAA-12 domain-containing protein n=1 Tax=Mycena indigotica TaxID=2126181 RepID=A0A8H6T900_9AGAR|nr:AAA-12 domain-containing protein [Mycena indigotica]KAF7312416.1 AAA-12 domain-containing protein [Mycena indigotica]
MSIEFLQTILDGVEQPLELVVQHESELTEEFLEVFNEEAQPLGIAPGYSKEGALVALSIADDCHCLIVRFYSPRRSDPNGRGRGRGRGARGNGQQRSEPPPNFAGRKILEKVILCRNEGQLLAFDCGPLAMSLFCLEGEGLRIQNAVDIQAAFSAFNRRPLTSIVAAVGDSIRVFTENVETAFRNPFYVEGDKHCRMDLANRAWVSQYLATTSNGETMCGKAKIINTNALQPGVLNILAKMTSDSLRLSNLKPTQKKHEVIAVNASDGLSVKSASFASRLRGSENLSMQVLNARGQSYEVYGQSGGVDGRRANLDVPRPLDGSKTILQITSIGRDDPTTAEAQRAATILSALQGNIAVLTDNAWIKNVWLPSSDDLGMQWPARPQVETGKKTKQLSVQPVSAEEDNLGRLNASQREAAEAMLSPKDDHRIVLIQGPPGTGKTSVIAAYVKTAIQQSQLGIWLVAKSNVAVINIALKLQATGMAILYTGIRQNFIRSDEFKTLSHSRMTDCKVILCTVSMLSNYWVKTKFRNYIPVTRIIVDEASQIEIGDYLPVFEKYGEKLEKMCFIGDDKQLPPYGQEDLQDLQSVFELSHLQTQTYFLDTQYRMPPQIGAFISEKVYNNQLKSNPSHLVPDTDIACQFINVPGAKEVLNNNSYFNNLEAQAIIKLALLLQERNKSFKIITPYDGQRVLIENTMKETEGLEWEEKVYNVDSFQGNEEDIIIISLVRSISLGFLQNLRRTNVMLTRCKRAMYIVSSKAFLKDGAGKDCIVGELGEHVGDLGWLESQVLESGDFLDNPRKREV